MMSSLRIRVGRITFNTVNHYAIKAEEREAMQLKRLMDKMKSKNKSQGRSPVLLEKGILSSAYANEGSGRRVTVLNKVYMEQITLMLNSGAYGRQFEDLGIEITKVNLASGLNFLNMYWIARKQDIPEHIINETLLMALRELQEKMGDIRFMSKVPLLKFVKDLRLQREIELEKIFQSADFGRDFEPIYGKKVLTQDFAHKPFEMPVMRQNVLGLDHAKIKGRIMAQITKFKAINTAPPKQEEEDEEEYKMPHKLIKFSKNEFFKFYKRRRILELKMRKKEKQAGDNIQYEYENTYDFEEENEDEDVYEEDIEEEDKSQLKSPNIKDKGSEGADTGFHLRRG